VPRLRRRIPATAIVLVGLLPGGLAAAGCSPGLDAEPTTSPRPTPSAVAPTSDAPASSTVTLDGVASRGALPSCTVFTSVDGRHFVLLGAPDTPLGVPVTVTGTADPAAASYCNAGTPLQVTAEHRR